MDIVIYYYSNAFAVSFGNKFHENLIDTVDSLITNSSRSAEVNLQNQNCITRHPIPARPPLQSIQPGMLHQGYLVLL